MTSATACALAVLVGLRLLPGCGVSPASSTPQTDLTPEEAQAIAKEAYIYGFPMVMG